MKKLDFLRFLICPRPSAGIGVAKTRGLFASTRDFLRFLICPHDPLRGLQKLEVFFICPRDPLRGSGEGTSSSFFCDFCLPAQPSAGISVVEVQKLERGTKTRGVLRFCGVRMNNLRGSGSRCDNSFFFCDSCGARSTLCWDRRGRGTKARARLRRADEPSAGIGAVEVRKLEFFFAISDLSARPSAGIGVVEVQKLEVFCVGVVEVKNSRSFAFSDLSATLCGDRRGGGVKARGLFASTRDFLRFLICPRGPLRGLHKTRGFFYLPARPSAGIG